VVQNAVPMKKLLLLISVTLFFIASCTFEKREVPPPEFKCDTTVHYNPAIDSIIVTSCMPPHGGTGCHEAGSSNGDYTSYAGLKAKVDNGTLMNQVVTTKLMPLGATLSQADIDRVHCWIIQGGLNN